MRHPGSHGRIRRPLRANLVIAAATLAAAFALDVTESVAEEAEPATSHWSTKRLARPCVPAARSSEWVRNPIDAFVAATHQEMNLTPSPEADRRTLIRRLTYDLHGLPPSPEGVREYLEDGEPGAYERLVDRLLASPRYGERWARHWLDVAHYGETHGFDKDQRRDNAWPYRDYVIRAFNDDLPYARFVQEQIAGDLLRPDEPEGIIATGFLAAGPWDLVGQAEVREGTAEKQRVRNLDRDDIVTSVFNTFMSTTVQCARCHDHKFDPISLDDYYSLQAVFADIDRGDRDHEPPGRARTRRNLREKKTRKSDELAKLEAKIDSHLPEWFAKLEDDVARWRKELESGAGTSSPSNGYHSVVYDTPDREEWVQIDLGESVRIERIVLIPARPTDYKDTPGFGFPLRWHASASDTAEFDDEVVVFDSREKVYPNPGDDPVLIEPDGLKARYLRINANELWERNQDYAFALAEVEIYSGSKQIAHKKTVTASSSIEFGRWRAAGLVDGYSSRAPLRSDDVGVAERSHELKQKIADAESRLSNAEESFVPGALLSKRTELNGAIAELNKEEAMLPKPEKVYSVKRIEPRPVYALQRGDVRSRLDLAQPAALRHVTGVDGKISHEDGTARGALAQWVTQPENGLTWRSIVNRVWQFHIGQGLVTTPNDFGWAGAEPTHPDLLDWLAVEFRDSGGSFKHLHRMILSSATYRQQSAHSTTNAAVDAQNRYLWRMNRRKLDAESVRDAILAISGTLDLTMGGPSVELFNYTHDHSPRYDYIASDDPKVFRRSVYRYIVRSVPDPLFEAFDCADPNISTPRRNETLTALQALTLMNDAFVLQQAGHFASRLRHESGDTRQQIRDAFQFALARPPSKSELKSLEKYARTHGTENLARLVFNLNEFIFVD